MSSKNTEKFIAKLTQSLHKETFVKMTLGNYKGDDKHLQKLLMRLIKTKKGIRLFLLYRYDTRDTAKNYGFHEGVKRIRSMLNKDFYSGHLFTSENDFQLDIGKKGRSRLNVARPTFKVTPDIEHDRRKPYFIDPASFYLKALGISNDDGRIRDKQRDKWKQINKFVETLAKLIDGSPLKNNSEINVLDVGAGKGYLTFAAYDYFNNDREIDLRITGIDTKTNLVDLCNDIARSCEFTGLEFRHGYIDDFDLKEIDILIALHACNTATDDAIFKGIQAEADLIVVAPCCHQEIRPQIKAPEMMENILKHGIMLEREAESITDGLRALLLEKSGYSAKVFEFISNEHTPKNNMIVGTRRKMNAAEAIFERQISAIKDFYGIKTHHLENLLRNQKPR